MLGWGRRDKGTGTRHPASFPRFSADPLAERALQRANKRGARDGGIAPAPSHVPARLSARPPCR
jgi:hypothetical protein